MAKASKPRAAAAPAPTPAPVDPFLQQLIDHGKDIVASLEALQNPGSNQDPYMARLDVWEALASLLASVRETEMDFRRQLFAGAFPNPKEGTNVHKLPDGRVIKGVHKINRYVDAAALPSVLAALREKGVANADQLVRYKPELAKREWSSLSDENKLAFSPAIIATEGSPQFEVWTSKQAGR